MSKISDCIDKQLSDDMVSHGWFTQCIEQMDLPRREWQSVLAELLLKDVEVGDALRATPEYVEFIAWKGQVEERVLRAIKRVEDSAIPDREFAYWLALRKHVDRFEGDET